MPLWLQVTVQATQISMSPLSSMTLRYPHVFQWQPRLRDIHLVFGGNSGQDINNNPSCNRTMDENMALSDIPGRNSPWPLHISLFLTIISSSTFLYNVQTPWLHFIFLLSIMYSCLSHLPSTHSNNSDSRGRCLYVFLSGSIWPGTWVSFFQLPQG